MIEFNYENDFILDNEAQYALWVSDIIASEDKTVGEINYIFCDDAYLHKINMEALNHDTLTDIISFDYTVGDCVSGDIFLSTERVRDNAIDLNVPFDEELLRVMSHGILHYCGYKDKIEAQIIVMRNKENEKIKMFHVER